MHQTRNLEIRSDIDDEDSINNESNWFSLDDWFAFENLTKRVSGLNMQVSPFDEDPVYKEAFDQIARALHRRSPRHLAIRREKGVGDAAFLAEFCRKSAKGKYAHLTTKQFVKVDCRFTVPEQSHELLVVLFSRLANQPDLVLCLDGLASLFCSAQVRSLFVSLVARTDCRIIVLLTPQEFEDFFAGRPDTDEFFSQLDLNEPSLDTAKRLVKHYAEGLSMQYSVEIDQNAIERSVQLTHAFMPSARLPAKAIRILADACDNFAFDRLHDEKLSRNITEADVIQRISAISGVPESTLAGLPDGINYHEALRSRIVGQDHVIEEVATELGLIRAGMVDKGKPASVMLFVGQTGTGKTELAKVIAKLYSGSKKLKTFTLGNYSEPHSVSGIIGVPPGYVGHEQGGRLINELNMDPYSVFLMDEADKAHPDVMQPFLNLFDEGWIVDQRGVKSYAERAIFILTTNVGQRQIADMHKKGKSWEEIHAKQMESLSQIKHAKANRPVFSAEFLARLKRVIIFKPLDAVAMAAITEQICSDISERWLQDRQKRLIIDKKVIEKVSLKSQDQNEKSKGKEGGRIVRKVIADLIESVIQSQIAQYPEAYRKCSVVRIDNVDNADTHFAVSFLD